MTTPRALLALLAALLVAVQVVRSAGVSALVDRSPDAAARVWPAHPESETALAMTEIGRAARGGKPVSPKVFAMVRGAAIKAPLAPEPFLVRGVQAQLAGNARLAIDAFAAAAQRDPRSLPAHYFLADELFRSGETRRGLNEVGILARLAPGGAASLAPYVAAYARDPRTWPQLRELFRSEPSIEQAALTALAADPANANTILALAGEHGRRADAPWLQPLLNSLVTAGQFAKAREVWASVSNIASAGGIYDPAFSKPAASPPFNWTLMSSTVGLAERRSGGGLHVIFYGREDGLLAQQLLVLPPGTYRLAISLFGNPVNGHALNWSVRCNGSQAPLAALPIDAAASHALTFAVPTGCMAQWVELSGVSPDVAQQSEVTIRSVALTRGRRDG